MKNPVHIARERWVIVRGGTDILCGYPRDLDFKPINNVGDAVIKTYRTREKAIISFNKVWFEDYDDSTYKAVKVTESISAI